MQNKDVFMIYTKAHLTRRLILGTSADSEKEENMVEWLREVGMPADFINKLSRMFQDIKGKYRNYYVQKKKYRFTSYILAVLLLKSILSHLNFLLKLILQNCIQYVLLFNFKSCMNLDQKQPVMDRVLSRI